MLNGGNTNFFTITVVDVNDNPPIFDGQQGSQISLDMPEVCHEYNEDDGDENNIYLMIL